MLDVVRDVMTTSEQDGLTAMSPAEIDTLLAPIASAEAEAYSRAYELRASARRTARESTAARYQAQAAELDVKAEELGEQAAPYRAEFNRRGGWTRIYWCQANGGHAHSSLHCSTLRVTTRMSWLPELSGKDEAALVELAGESACTICYPSAPVSVLAKPSQLAPAREAREAKAARDAELAVKRAAKDAKSINNPDGTQLRGEYGVINTVVSAWREVVEDAADTELYDYAWTPRKQEVQDRVVAALANKLGETEEQVRATLAAKVAAKVKRDRR